MRISDWSSDVCSSDLWHQGSGWRRRRRNGRQQTRRDSGWQGRKPQDRTAGCRLSGLGVLGKADAEAGALAWPAGHGNGAAQHLGDQIIGNMRSEEHTSELQSLMRNSYAVFCLKKKKK